MTREEELDNGVHPWMTADTQWTADEFEEMLADPEDVAREWLGLPPHGPLDPDECEYSLEEVIESVNRFPLGRYREKGYV